MTANVSIVCNALIAQEFLKLISNLKFGLKEDGSSGLREGFFINGVTCATLKASGKTPCEKDKLARSEIKTEKRVLHDLRRIGGILSTGENLALVIAAAISVIWQYTLH